ncbi:hypothetical protein ACFVGV_00420 [Pseudarthrobacter scleromae]|uniref:hypothetical protein n=1 Tax=Pseudarthrobacter scleromae TaxID=158897 RepID=UPI003624BCB1
MTTAKPVGILKRNETTISLFADCLVVGIYVLVVSAPLVTAFAGLTAGCALLRARTRHTGSISPAAFLHQLAEVFRSSRSMMVISGLLAILVGMDLLALLSGLGAHPVLTAPFAIVVSLALVLALRTAAAWRRGKPWLATAKDVFGIMVRDARGSLLLLGAIFTAFSLTFLTPGSAVVCLGPLVLAAVVVDARASAIRDVVHRP